jgi:ribonuclease-3
VGPEGPEAGSAADSSSDGDARARPRRRRRGGRGRRRPADAAPGPSAEGSTEIAPTEAPAPHRAPRSRPAERPAAAAEPARRAPAPQDDFGFDADESPPASDAGAGAPSADAPPGDDGEPRRRRRRRGGRGRRRRNGEPDAGLQPPPAPVAASAEPEAAAPEAEHDDFGAHLDPGTTSPSIARAAARAEAARVEAEHTEAAPFEADAPPRDRAPRAPRRDGRERAAPRPAPRPAPRASPQFSSPPHGVEDWFSPARLDACQRAIHYYFRDVSLLENALTHSSIKSDDRPSYERLEFLGDSVIGIVIADYLYHLRPDFDEGDLTKVKSEVVSTDGLADAAIACGLDKFLAVGRGILMKNVVPRSLIADVFEGVVGAVYLDRGYETVRLYVLDLLGPRVRDALSDRSPRNFKSVLQQVAQRDFGETPFYEVLRESGPEHARAFEVVAVVGRRRFGVARAPTKKEAEQAAAKLALQTILMEKSSRKPPPRRRRSR